MLLAQLRCTYNCCATITTHSYWVRVHIHKTVHLLSLYDFFLRSFLFFSFLIFSFIIFKLTVYKALKAWERAETHRECYSLRERRRKKRAKTIYLMVIFSTLCIATATFCRCSYLHLHEEKKQEKCRKDQWWWWLH